MVNKISTHETIEKDFMCRVSQKRDTEELEDKLEVTKTVPKENKIPKPKVYEK